MIRLAINSRERRDNPGKATEQPWDEDAIEYPDVVMRPAQPEIAHPDPADTAAGVGDHRAVR